MDEMLICCVGDELEEILSSTGGPTVSYINEDVVEPEHAMELTTQSSEGDRSMVKDFNEEEFRCRTSRRQRMVFCLQKVSHRPSTCCG
ncbi:hypothetical protein BDR05DRAFT_971745 [Suillus weaverae]|nr:hypothetical protein BDR05DRAFT_971745 [Suillus weaverae]